ncbi:hypothetical protein [Alkalihalophilus marmarensis]|uniref:hypothetical protein n=1 Tax=Alkalihalophilus marmarensis TaxID=521377 RepID=UPI002E2369C5|nr:hypothetical protein [Alkalihalophilus marmarensis]
MDWILENKEWIFSGAGIAIFTVLGAIFKRKKSNKQTQKLGDNSTAYQAGGNISIGDKDGNK